MSFQKFKGEKNHASHSPGDQYPQKDAPQSQQTFRSDIFCPQGENPREQMNGITAFIDGSNIYGSTEEVAIKLRINETFGAETFPGALLRTGLSKHTAGQNHEALPSRKQCRFASPRPVPTPDDLTSGDTRAVVQPGLTSMHTLFLHEHNRIARELESLWASEAETKDLSARTGAEFVFEVRNFLSSNNPKHHNSPPACEKTGRG